MKCKIFLEYNGFDDSSFSDMNNYYGNGEYENALINGFNNDITVSRVNDKEEMYSSCEGNILDENGEETTIEQLYYDIDDNKVGKYTLDIDFDTMDEDFETDFKMWIDSHNKIRKDYLEYDLRLTNNEPMRTLYIRVTTAKGIKLLFELSNCSIVGYHGDNGIVVAVEKIDFSNKKINVI